MSISSVDLNPDLIRLRTRAAGLYVLLLWLHAPVLLYMAAVSGVSAPKQGLLIASILALPTWFAIARPARFVTRMSIALAFTAMPILLVFDNPGHWQIEFHFYFFVVFAMLVAFCDWRCIVASAALTSVHHLLLNFIAPDRVFPEEGGLSGVALQAIFVAIECGTLCWAIWQLRKLFSSVEREQANAEAHAAVALKDNLTKLGNHRAFHEDFAKELSRARRHSRPLTLALIDIDDFKSINDDRGHKHGDEVLVRLAQLLGQFRKEDRAYRVGGDEFACLLVETNAESAQVVLERLRCKAPQELYGASLSIGYATLSSAQLDREPYELADSALYEAKRRGRNTVVGAQDLGRNANVFSPRKAAIVRKLIDNEQVEIAFQPIWDLASGKPFAFEALARPARELGLRGPGEAFDLAERIRLVAELDRLCFTKAVQKASCLPPNALVFVNVTPAWMEHFSFDPLKIVQTIRSSGLSPVRFVLEITERRITDAAALAERASVLNKYGVRIALDDTGAGQAGLQTMGKLDLAFVKIDRVVLQKAMVDKGSRGVLAGVVAISREIGAFLIAEGIENDEMLRFVRNLQPQPDGRSAAIQGVQGYLVGRPQVGQPDSVMLAWTERLLRRSATGSVA